MGEPPTERDALGGGKMNSAFYSMHQGSRYAIQHQDGAQSCGAAALQVPEYRVMHRRDPFELGSVHSCGKILHIVGSA